MFIDILRSAENSAKVIKEVITYKADGNGIKTVKKELLSPFYFDIFLSCDSFVHIHLYYSSVHNPIWMSIFFNVTFINIIATAP